MIANAVNLSPVAAEVLSRPELLSAGLKTLAREVMRVHIDKQECDDEQVEPNPPCRWSRFNTPASTTLLFPTRLAGCCSPVSTPEMRRPVRRFKDAFFERPLFFRYQ
jgi:hypothetical protein